MKVRKYDSRAGASPARTLHEPDHSRAGASPARTLDEPDVHPYRVRAGLAPALVILHPYGNRSMHCPVAMGDQGALAKPYRQGRGAR